MNKCRKRVVIGDWKNEWNRKWSMNSTMMRNERSKVHTMEMSNKCPHRISNFSWKLISLDIVVAFICFLSKSTSSTLIVQTFLIVMSFIIIWRWLWYWKSHLISWHRPQAITERKKANFIIWNLQCSIFSASYKLKVYIFSSIEFKCHRLKINKIFFHSYTICFSTSRRIKITIDELSTFKIIIGVCWLRK